MKIKNYIIGLITLTLLLNIFAIKGVSARMVFIKDDWATDADVFVLDADDSNANDIQLQFGQTFGKTLRWDNLNAQFTFNDKVNIEGDITLTGTVDGVDVRQLAIDVATHTGSTSNPHQVTFEQVRNQNNRILGDIDFNQNQAQNLVIENLSTAPANPVIGEVYFNTNDDKAYTWDGTTWLNMVSGGDNSSTDSDSFTIDNNNNGNPQILSFGSSLTHTLSFDVTNDWFNLSDRLNIGGNGLVDGIKLTTTASATDSEQNQIEIRDNVNNPVFAVDEDGDITSSGSMAINWDITLNGNVDGVDVSNLAWEVGTHTGATNNPHQVTLEQARSQDNVILGDLDFNQNQALNLVIENRTTPPSSPVVGQIYMNTANDLMYFWSGSGWIQPKITNMFFAYDGIGWQAVTKIPVTLNVDQVVVSDSYYSSTNDEITFLKGGLYKFDLNVALEVTDIFGQLRSDFEIRVQVNEGSGFVDIPYAIGAGNYIRETVDRTSANTTFLKNFNTGDTVRIQIVQISYETHINTLQNGSNITIEYIR